MERDEFFDMLNVELKISKKSKYTIKNYSKANFELLDSCKKSPEEITNNDVKKLLAEKISDRASSSVVLFLAAVRFAYLSIFNKDPTAGIKRPPKEKKIPVVLSKEEIKKIIEFIKNKKSKLIVSLIYACGFRVSELINLKIQDLDFNNKIGYIKQAKGKKDRIFNLPSFLSEELKEQAENQKQNSQEYLFTGKKGKLTDRNIQKIVRIAAKRAGIEKSVHTHTLRHSFATHLLENNVDIRKIQELLGHENLSTTQIYTHISTEELKKIPSPIDNLYK